MSENFAEKSIFSYDMNGNVLKKKLCKNDIGRPSYVRVKEFQTCVDREV